MLSVTIAALHANADLLVGVVIGLAVGFLAGPMLRAWLALAEWRAPSREAELTDELLGRLGRDLDGLGEVDGPTRGDGRTWPTSR